MNQSRTSCMTEALANIMFCHPGLHFMKPGIYLNTLLSKISSLDADQLHIFDPSTHYIGPIACLETDEERNPSSC
jgi:hypothetical protein